MDLKFLKDFNVNLDENVKALLNRSKVDCTTTDIAVAFAAALMVLSVFQLTLNSTIKQQKE